MEDYKKKYEIAIKQAKEKLKVCGSLDCDAARQIFRFFPELKESEDERIRKDIIAFIESTPKAKNYHPIWIAWLEKQKQYPELNESEDEKIGKQLLNWFKDCKWDAIDNETLKRGDIIAWLEKQGEHANFRNKIQIGDKVTRNEDGVLVNLSQLERVAKPAEKQGSQNLANSAKTCKDEQKTTWSEEDEKMLHEISQCIYDNVVNIGTVNKVKCIDWLKSLRDRMKGE